VLVCAPKLVDTVGESSGCVLDFDAGRTTTARKT
jgi:hypothetical protein